MSGKRASFNQGGKTTEENRVFFTVAGKKKRFGFWQVAPGIISDVRDLDSSKTPHSQEGFSHLMQNDYR